jgi:hypothetical protein
MNAGSPPTLRPATRVIFEPLEAAENYLLVDCR